MAARTQAEPDLRIDHRGCANTGQAAAYTGRTVAALANLRYRGRGPRYTGGRTPNNPVVYPYAELDAWLRQNTR